MAMVSGSPALSFAAKVISNAGQGNITLFEFFSFFGGFQPAAHDALFLAVVDVSIPTFDCNLLRRRNLMIIGKCRSGRELEIGTDLTIQDLQSYSVDDLFDSHAMLLHLSIRAKRRDESDWAKTFRMAAYAAKSRLTAGDFQRISSAMSLKTAFDLNRLGKTLLRPEFQE